MNSSEGSWRGGATGCLDVKVRRRLIRDGRYTKSLCNGY